jgi:hypothetical protein
MRRIGHEVSGIVATLVVQLLILTKINIVFFTSLILQIAKPENIGIILSIITMSCFFAAMTRLFHEKVA